MVAQVVELIDVQLLGGQEVLSRFHYVNTDGVADPEVLVDDYISDVIPLVAAMQSTDLSHVAIRYRKVYPTAELVAERPVSPPVAGTDGAAAAPPNASYSIKFGIGATVQLAGGTKHIKKGGKHLPGVTMDQLDFDALSSSGIVTAAAAWFTEAKQPGTADAFLLCVASFEVTPSHVVNTHSTRTLTKAVLLPTVTKYAMVLSASPPSVSTQNTRKVLRGRTY